MINRRRNVAEGVCWASNRAGMKNGPVFRSCLQTRTVSCSITAFTYPKLWGYSRAILTQQVPRCLRSDLRDRE